MAEQLSKRTVAEALRAAGYDEARRSPWEPGEGWTVEPYFDNGVAVRVINIVAKDGVAGQVREHDLLKLYTDALRRHGWRVDQDQVGHGVALMVRSPFEEA
jgi:hypothetical protein